MRADVRAVELGHVGGVQEYTAADVGAQQLERIVEPGRAAQVAQNQGTATPS